MEKQLPKCPWCREEYEPTKAYSFFHQRTGQWYEGHKICMNNLQFELDYRRTV